MLTPVFAALSSPLPEMAVDMMAVIEWYVVLLYDRMSGYVLVNQAQKEMLTKNGRNTEQIPPSQSSLN